MMEVAGAGSAAKLYDVCDETGQCLDGSVEGAPMIRLR